MYLYSPLDDMLAHNAAPPFLDIKFASTHLYKWVERDWK